MKYYVVWNVFNEEENRYRYVPKGFNICDILTKKVLKGWSFRHLLKNGSFSQKKCKELCKKYDNVADD